MVTDVRVYRRLRDFYVRLDGVVASLDALTTETRITQDSRMLTNRMKELEGRLAGVTDDVTAYLMERRSMRKRKEA